VFENFDYSQLSVPINLFNLDGHISQPVLFVHPLLLRLGAAAVLAALQGTVARDFYNPL
jgi:hypothetical protein